MPEQKLQLPYALFGFALVLQAYSLWAGFHLPILEEHSFRQTQTAFSAWAMLEGGAWWRYETPLLGAPWSIPFEWPVYQWCLALFTKLSGLPLEEAGRLLSRIFFWIACVPLWAGAKELGWKREERLLLLSLFLVSPLYLFWSRTMLIETAALAFALGYGYALLRFARKRDARAALFAAVLGAAAAAVKVTTFAPLGLAGAMFFFFRRKKLPLLWAGLALAVPLLAGLGWTVYTDAVKNANPLARFITSSALREWNIGGISDRLAPAFWNMLFRQTLHDAGGHRLTFLLAISAAGFIPQARARFASWFALFLAAPLLFTPLHRAHNYYACANGVFLTIAFAEAMRWLLRDRRKKIRWAGMALAALAALLSLREYQRGYLPRQWRDNGGVVEFGRLLQEITSPDEVLLVYGQDWHPMFPYYARRRALMDREDRPAGDPALERSLALLQAEGRKIGAVLGCGNAGLPLGIAQRFHLKPDPELRHFCSVYRVP